MRWRVLATSLASGSATSTGRRKGGSRGGCQAPVSGRQVSAHVMRGHAGSSRATGCMLPAPGWIASVCFVLPCSWEGSQGVGLRSPSSVQAARPSSGWSGVGVGGCGVGGGGVVERRRLTAPSLTRPLACQPGHPARCPRRRGRRRACTARRPAALPWTPPAAPPPAARRRRRRACPAVRWVGAG